MDLILDRSGADRLITAVGRKLPQALARALNRGISAGRTAMVRLVSKDMGLRASDVRSQMPIVNATPANLIARVTSPKKRISLIQFGAKGPVPSRGKGRGVTYRIGQGGRKRIPDAFIATMASGHTGVFVRVGKARLPIKELYGPSLGQVFTKYLPDGEQRATEQFQTTFVQGLRYRTGAA